MQDPPTRSSDFDLRRDLNDRAEAHTRRFPVQDALFTLDELGEAPVLSLPMVPVGKLADLGFERSRRRFSEGA